MLAFLHLARGNQAGGHLNLGVGPRDLLPPGTALLPRSLLCAARSRDVACGSVSPPRAAGTRGNGAPGAAGARGRGGVAGWPGPAPPGGSAGPPGQTGGPVPGPAAAAPHLAVLRGASPTQAPGEPAAAAAGAARGSAEAGGGAGGAAGRAAAARCGEPRAGKGERSGGRRGAGAVMARSSAGLPGPGGVSGCGSGSGSGNGITAEEARRARDLIPAQETANKMVVSRGVIFRYCC